MRRSGRRAFDAARTDYRPCEALGGGQLGWKSCCREEVSLRPGILPGVMVWRKEHEAGRVVFLGTGDPLNEDRAQTSLAVPLARGETMLLDASSGTVSLRQLAASGIAPESVRYLFVTHRHFDHVGGLAPLLFALTTLPKASITFHASAETLGALHELLALTIPGVED